MANSKEVVINLSIDADVSEMLALISELAGELNSTYDLLDDISRKLGKGPYPRNKDLIKRAKTPPWEWRTEE